MTRGLVDRIKNLERDLDAARTEIKRLTTENDNWNFGPESPNELRLADAERERDGAVAVCYAREGQAKETVYWRERAEDAERELAEARKALMWTAKAFAEQPGPDIPKDVRAAYVAARVLDAKEER